MVSGFGLELRVGHGLGVEGVEFLEEAELLLGLFELRILRDVQREHLFALRVRRPLALHRFEVPAGRVAHKDTRGIHTRILWMSDRGFGSGFWYRW